MVYIYRFVYFCTFDFYFSATLVSLNSNSAPSLNISNLTSSGKEAASSSRDPLPHLSDPGTTTIHASASACDSPPWNPLYLDLTQRLYFLYLCAALKSLEKFKRLTCLNTSGGFGPPAQSFKSLFVFI